MSDATPNLNKALAAFQAEAPRIVKDEVGIIPGKDGKQGYKYRYADLATVAAVTLPLLGKHGLSFFTKPVIVGTQFGLACKLKHASGEEEEGFYPLPSSATPQQVGSAITYARRYSLLMMTGLAPADDDDDAAATTTQRFAPQSAAAAFETASPVKPASRPEPVRSVAEAKAPPAAETDWDWMSHLTDDLIPAATSRAELAAMWANIAEHVAKGECTDENAEQIRAFIKERAAELGLEMKAA
jgi:ERF superfamily